MTQNETFNAYIEWIYTKQTPQKYEIWVLVDFNTVVQRNSTLTIRQLFFTGQSMNVHGILQCPSLVVISC